MISADTALGRLLRQPLRLVPAGTVVPVLSGLNRGRRWVVGVGVHGFWLGFYERAKQRALRRFMRPGLTVYDLGANAGFYTPACARLTGPEGRVVAFEPWPANVAALSRHLSLNGIDNAEIIGRRWAHARKPPISKLAGRPRPAGFRAVAKPRGCRWRWSPWTASSRRRGRRFFGRRLHGHRSCRNPGDGGRPAWRGDRGPGGVGERAGAIPRQWIRL